MTTKRKETKVVNAPAKPAPKKAKPYVGTQPDTQVTLDLLDIPDGMDVAAVSSQVAYLLKTGRLFNNLPAADTEDGKEQPKTVSSVHDTIVSLDVELTALHDALGGLTDTLEPVLAYDEKAEASKNPDLAVSQSPLHSRLLDLRFRLGVATERVRIITGRVRI